MRLCVRNELKMIPAGAVLCKMRGAIIEEPRILGGVIDDDAGNVIDFWSQTLVTPATGDDENGPDVTHALHAICEGRRWPLGDDEHGRDGLFEGDAVLFLILDVDDLDRLAGMIAAARAAYQNLAPIPAGVKTETITAGSLTKLFQIFARMLKEHQWRVVRPPSPRREGAATLWDLRIERDVAA